MLSKMLKSALIGSIFITLSYAGNLSIEDREDVVRVSNNVHFFWGDNADLIDPVMKKSKLSEANKEKLFHSKQNSIVKEFLRSPDIFKKDLINTINYVKSNQQSIKELIGGEQEHQSFINGLLLLQILINDCI